MIWATGKVGIYGAVFHWLNSYLVKKCAVKGAGLQRVKLPPGNWFAPPGSNRNGGGGNEAVGAFDVEGR